MVSWVLDQTLEIGFVLEAIAQARRAATPEIWNTDQGSHFTSSQVIQPLEEAGIRVSMDGKGRASDNIFTERFWRSLKYEEVYLADYNSPRAAREGIGRYMRFYNIERPHQALNYRRPAELYLIEQADGSGENGENCQAFYRVNGGTHTENRPNLCA